MGTKIRIKKNFKKPNLISQELTSQHLKTNWDGYNKWYNKKTAHHDCTRGKKNAIVGIRMYVVENQSDSSGIIYWLLCNLKKAEKIC